jgi:hypothetical protein
MSSYEFQRDHPNIDKQLKDLMRERLKYNNEDLSTAYHQIPKYYRHGKPMILKERFKIPVVRHKGRGGAITSRGESTKFVMPVVKYKEI